MTADRIDPRCAEGDHDYDDTHCYDCGAPKPVTNEQGNYADHLIAHLRAADAPSIVSYEAWAQEKARAERAEVALAAAEERARTASAEATATREAVERVRSLDPLFPVPQQYESMSETRAYRDGAMAQRQATIRALDGAS